MEFRWGYNCNTIREGKNFRYEIQWVLTGWGLSLIHI